MPYKDPDKYREYHRLYEANLRKNPRPKTDIPRDLGPSKITGYTFRGKPILLTGQRGRPVTGGVARAMEQGIFPQEKYVQAATLFAATGSTTKVSEISGIPEKTIKSWIRQKAFKDLLNEIRAENDEKIDAAYCEIIETALEGLKERLEGGDHVLSKTGEIVRVPVKARDLASTTSTIVTQRQLMRGKPTSRTEQVGDVKRLELLAEQFIKMTQNKRKPLEIEGQYVEVLEEVKEVEEKPDEPQ